MICPKVRLADIVDCRRRDQKGFRKIAAKHIDFTIADSHDCTILLAIELDDRTHDRSDRRRRDRFVEQALTDAGVPLLRFKTSRRYDAVAISTAIEEALRSRRVA